MKTQFVILQATSNVFMHVRTHMHAHVFYMYMYIYMHAHHDMYACKVQLTLVVVLVEGCHPVPWNRNQNVIAASAYEE